MLNDTDQNARRGGKARKQAGLLAKFLEVPANSVMGGVHIEMNSNRELFIEGCKGVLEYNDKVIRVTAADMNVKVTGLELQLRNLTPDTVLVEGSILSVEFI